MEIIKQVPGRLLEDGKFIHVFNVNALHVQSRKTYVNWKSLNHVEGAPGVMKVTNPLRNLSSLTPEERSAFLAINMNWDAARIGR